MSERYRTAKGRLGWREFLVSLFLMAIVWVAREFFSTEVLHAPSIEGDKGEETITIFFTQPVASSGVDAMLVDAIDSAQSKVDIAVYDLGLEQVADVLVAASKRGVAVRLVTEAEYADEEAIIRVQGAGIPVVMDAGEPFMHNKFMVIDGAQVWTGSWNLTTNGTYHNDNNVVVVNSEQLARAYTSEFEEMFENRWFGTASPLAAAHLKLQIGDVEGEVIFEPEGDARSRILTLLQEAQSSIYFMAFSFTDDGIADAIVERSQSGLDVRGVVESRTVDDPGAEFDFLERSGVDVLLDGNPYMMHHKVIVVDKAVVITGSYNFTRSAAEKNDENVLILRSPEVAARYVEEFQRVYQAAEEVR